MIFKNRFTFNGKVFDKYGQIENEDFSLPYYHGTTCCAAGWMSLKNNNSLEEISEFIQHIRNHSNTNKFSPKERDGGERLILVTVCPNEDNLRENLKKLKFTNIWKFNRRNGYPKTGKLELWALDI